MSATGDPHMPGRCWCGAYHILTDAAPFSDDFPEMGVYRPVNPLLLLGTVPRLLTDDEIRQIVRDEFHRLRAVDKDGE